MDRTVRILLQPKSEQKTLLEETSKQFTQVFNAVCAYGWHNNEKNGVKLHHATYYDLREKYPNLGSNVLIQARIKATEALKSAYDRKTKGRKVGQPKSKSCPLRYNERTSTLDWENQTVNLSTVNGRIIVSFKVPPLNGNLHMSS
jgi:putative transposase